jgi:hypothetical protein
MNYFIKRLNNQKQCVWELIRKFGILASLYSDKRMSTGVSFNKPVETENSQSGSRYLYIKFTNLSKLLLYCCCSGFFLYFSEVF